MIRLWKLGKAKAHEEGQDGRRLVRAALIDETRKRLEDYRKIENETPDPGQRVDVQVKRQAAESELRRLEGAGTEHADLLEALGFGKP